MFNDERYNKKFEFIPKEFIATSILYLQISQLPEQIIPAIENSKLYQSATKKQEDSLFSE